MRAGDIKRVVVVGAGTMGACIAGEFARIGCQVAVVDLNPAQLANGKRILAHSQRTLVAAKRLTRQAVREETRRITWTSDLAHACREAHLVVEAVSEDMAVKRALFAQCDRLCPPATILATNTSGLSVTRIASATRRAAQVAGMHFWNPPHIVPLVEVTRGRRTAEATLRLLLALARRMGKRPILVKQDIPGLVGNRLQFAVVREALKLLADGVASAEDIDTAMTAGPGLRYGLMGPLRTADLGGLDVFHAVSSYLFEDLSAAKAPPAVLSDLVAGRRLGAKTGHGFYRYTKAGRRRLIDRRDKTLLGFLDLLKD